jgi:hypothetical protein
VHHIRCGMSVITNESPIWTATGVSLSLAHYFSFSTLLIISPSLRYTASVLICIRRRHTNPGFMSRLSCRLDISLSLSACLERSCYQEVRIDYNSTQRRLRCATSRRQHYSFVTSPRQRLHVWNSSTVSWVTMRYRVTRTVCATVHASPRTHHPALSF